jgi:Ca2+-binding RTX toxin-like protein
VAIDVTPVNDNVPVISSGSVVSVAENTSAVIDVNATDADLPAETLLYSISGGVDGGLFSINGATGVVTFVAPPDFEMPADAGADNVYNFEVTVSDGLLSSTQAIAVQVTNVGELDFGDAPDSYKTLLGSNGASHLQSVLFLGDSIDADADGQPTTLANGDDSDLDGDDENGVTLPATLFAGVNANLSVTASAAGKLDAWIDFDRSGTFEESEKIFANINVAAGVNALTIAVPANVMAGATYARFRLSTAGGLSPTGSASDGEVEDYTLQLSKPAALSAQLVADPQHPGDTLLLVNGSANSDAIIVQPVPGSTTQYRVVFPGIVLGPFTKSDIDRIEIHSHGGSDSIAVDAAIFEAATIYAGDGNDSVVGGSGDDLIFGEAGVDSLAGGAGNDVVHGGNDADYLYGGLGNDVLIGGNGSDWLFGEGGDDLLIGSNGPSSVTDLCWPFKPSGARRRH